MALDAFEMDQARSGQAPRIVTVLVFLAAFSIIISWMGVYAVTNALVAADVISAFPTDSDPRRMWMLQSFLGLFGLFAIVALSFWFLSHRQLRRIDQMADAEG